MFATVVIRRFYLLDTCYKTITPHNHSGLYSKTTLQADFYFDLQAKVRIFLTQHILKYSMNAIICVFNYSPHKHCLNPDLIFLFLILLDSSFLHFVSDCNIFYSNITCNILSTLSSSYRRFETISCTQLEYASALFWSILASCQYCYPLLIVLHFIEFIIPLTCHSMQNKL